MEHINERESERGGMGGGGGGGPHEQHMPG